MSELTETERAMRQLTPWERNSKYTESSLIADLNEKIATLEARLAECHSALDRLLNSYRLLLAQKPVRDATETITEAEAAIDKARADNQGGLNGRDSTGVVE